MKKIISVLLALIMVFSLTTVAFAEDTVTDENTSTETGAPSEGGEGEAEGEESEEDSLLGEYDWILDLPFATVKPALKIAKIALKLYMVYLKLGSIFGFVDTEAITQQFADFIGGLIGNAQPDDGAAEEPSTIPAAA